MTLLENIEEKIKKAMREKDSLMLETLRSIKTALQVYKVNIRKPITTEVEQSILSKLANQRNESLVAFTAAGRFDLGIKESKELEIIESFMVRKATDAEYFAAIYTAVFSNHKNGEKPNLGVIIKSAKEVLKDLRVDGKVLTDKIKEALNL